MPHVKNLQLHNISLCVVKCLLRANEKKERDI